MASLYNFRKEQLSGSQKINVANVDIEIQKVRSQSPKPQVKNSNDNVENKKIAYKHELEEIKNKVNLIDISSKTLEQTLNNVIEQHKKEVLSVVDSKLEDNKKQMENLKVENLKNVLNDSIQKMNEQLKNIASQLVNNTDVVNELKIRIEDIEKLI